MKRPKNETEDLLLSITKNCNTLIKHTHTKPEETLEFQMKKPREAFHFNPPVEIKEDWMIGLTNLEIYISAFNITERRINLFFINFLMKRVVVFHMKKSEMRLKETWTFRILQIAIYKMGDIKYY